MSTKKILLTKEGLAEIQKEFTFLKETKRVEVAEKLKEAISYGDLSENSEYEDARNEQSQVELRIQELEEILKNYQLVDSKAKSDKKIGIGSIATIKHISDLDSHKGEEERYMVVGTTESDIYSETKDETGKLLYNGKISNESPIGKAILGRSVGDAVAVKSPAGTHEYEIIEIR